MGFHGQQSALFQLHLQSQKKPPPPSLVLSSALSPLHFPSALLHHPLQSHHERMGLDLKATINHCVVGSIDKEKWPAAFAFNFEGMLTPSLSCMSTELSDWNPAAVLTFMLEFEPICPSVTWTPLNYCLQFWQGYRSQSAKCCNDGPLCQYSGEVMIHPYWFPLESTMIPLCYYCNSSIKAFRRTVKATKTFHASCDHPAGRCTTMLQPEFEAWKAVRRLTLSQRTIYYNTDRCPYCGKAWSDLMGGTARTPPEFSGYDSVLCILCWYKAEPLGGRIPDQALHEFIGECKELQKFGVNGQGVREEVEKLERRYRKLYLSERQWWSVCSYCERQCPDFHGNQTAQQWSPVGTPGHKYAMCRLCRAWILRQPKRKAFLNTDKALREARLQAVAIERHKSQERINKQAAFEQSDSHCLCGCKLEDGTSLTLRGPIDSQCHLMPTPYFCLKICAPQWDKHFKANSRPSDAVVAEWVAGRLASGNPKLQQQFDACDGKYVCGTLVHRPDDFAIEGPLDDLRREMPLRFFCKAGCRLSWNRKKTVPETAEELRAWVLQCQHGPCGLGRNVT